MDILIILFILFFICLGVLILLVLMWKSRQRKESINTYKYMMLESYSNNRNVVYSLCRVRNHLKPKTKEYKAVQKAIDHLNYSIFKDYRTAFLYIESVFNDEEIDRINRVIMNKEKGNVILLLEKRGEEETSVLKESLINLYEDY